MGIHTDNLFCCGTDYAHEPPESIKWYSFIEDLKNKQPCWEECGIVEVIIGPEGEELFHKWIEESKML